MLSEKSANKIAELKQRYKDDADALDEIERATRDVEYIENREATGSYSGQPSDGFLEMLEANLEYWH
jgi:hypothetical protein